MLFARGLQTLMFKSSSFSMCKSGYIYAALVICVYTKYRNYSDPGFVTGILRILNMYGKTPAQGPTIVIFIVI